PYPLPPLSTFPTRRSSDLSHVAVGDFNGDGKPDLAVANEGTFQNNYTDGGVSVLLSKGDGTFFPAVNYGAGTHPFSIVAGDLNKDRKSTRLNSSHEWISYA